MFQSLLDVPLGFISVSPTVFPAQILAGLELWGPHQCPEVVALSLWICTEKVAEKEARPFPSVGHFPP